MGRRNLRALMIALHLISSTRMPVRLILNADDFGLTRGINQAIAELHQARVLTSATLMASGPALEDAVAVARALPTLGVGCHITLVDGTPAAPLHEVPSLLGPDGKRFRQSLPAFVRDLFLHRIDSTEIAHEARCQITRLQDAGVHITHVDTHKHTHIFPAVAKALLDTGLFYAIRNPFEPLFAPRPDGMSLSRRIQIAALNRFQPAFKRIAANCLTTNGTLGIAATGTLTADSLRHILNSLPAAGTYELCCHPGYNDADLDLIPTRLRTHREIERAALLSEVPKILSLPHPPELIHYGSLK